MCLCDNPPAIYERHEVKARKPWVCCECLSDIAVGERHEHVKGLWEGHWDEFRTCLRCVKLIADAECSCMPHERLMDYIDERDSPEYAEFHRIRDANYWRRKNEAALAKARGEGTP